MWFGVFPNCDDCKSRTEWETRLKEAFELFQSDPYSRHEAFWKRCNDQGYDSFMRFWGRQDDPFSGATALIDEAAKVLGDE
jgi:hypothetical protein